jgi:hypothetical protein
MRIGEQLSPCLSFLTLLDLIPEEEGGGNSVVWDEIVA